MEKQLTFIASGGRTGTKFFGDMLADVVSDCHSEHEPDMVAGLSMLTLDRVRRFGFWHMILGRLLGKTGVRVVGQRLLTGRISRSAALSRLKELRTDFHKSVSESLIVESYYAWWMVAGEIGNIWPDARVAGIVRDPRDWIASWLRHQPRRRNGALTEYLPPGVLTPARMGDAEVAQQWSALSQVGRLAWEWGMIVRKLDRAAGASPNVAVFRFEDLFGGDPAELDRFVAFVAGHENGPRHAIEDLSALTRTVRNASSGPKRSWQSWSDAEIAAVSKFCGSGMATYGYGTEAEWKQRVASAEQF